MQSTVQQQDLMVEMIFPERNNSRKCFLKNGLQVAHSEQPFWDTQLQVSNCELLKRNNQCLNECLYCVDQSLMNVKWMSLSIPSPGDIFENYCRDDDLATFGRFCYGITVILTFPIECFVTREVSTNHVYFFACSFLKLQYGAWDKHQKLWFSFMTLQSQYFLHCTRASKKSTEPCCQQEALSKHNSPNCDILE